LRDLSDHDLAAVLEVAPDAMVCVDGSGMITLVNAQAERLFGYHRAELVGRPVEVLVPEGVRPVHPGYRARYLADPRPRPMGGGMELSARRHDGTTFPTEISLSALQTARGIIVVAAVRDITARRRMHESAVRLASIIESSHEAIVGKTLDLIVTSWNLAAERLYGYTAAEMIGRSVEVLLPPGERGRELARLAAVLRGERVEENQAPRIRKDGSTVLVSLTMSPITDAAGATTGVSTVARDVGERQRAEARFLGLLEAAPDAMVCVERSGLIVLVNAQAERLFGYGRDELVGQPVETLVPESARGVHPGHRAGYLADPQPRPMSAGMQLAGRRKDGSTFPAEISLAAIDTDEGILVTAAVRDVTERLEAAADRALLKSHAERERLERQLQQSQRLESLGQLAGGVAHDFNNLLSVISGYATFVANAAGQDSAAEPWPSVLADVEQIQLAAARAAVLTRQLLTFARRELVQARVLDLNEIVTGVLTLLERTLGEHVELATDLGEHLGPVFADPGQVEQVLVNLAVNARDAMPGGGKLSIQTASFDVDQAYATNRANLAPGRHVALKVSDTGAGMPPEVVARAFEPFFTTKPKGEGTGLGLATVYGIVTQAGGDVRIYSEPGLGTTITVLLPVTGKPAPAGERPSGELERGDNQLILVVEDEAALREVTRRTLADNGYQVITAAAGQEAIDAVAASTRRIDALVTDLIMPGMQGQEVAERIRQLQPAITILFMSGYAQGLLGAQGVLEPGINLIEKPFTEASLLAKIGSILRTRPSP
jgi:two-component system, cell cycle sensor histidine kinase and response regulator CckA